MRAANGFLGGLAKHDERPTPLLFELRQHARGAQKNGHMNVVTASVHDADFGAVGALYFHVAGIGKAGVLDNGERIHVGTHVYRGTGAIAENADDSVGDEAGRIVLAEVVGLRADRK